MSESESFFLNFILKAQDMNAGSTMSAFGSHAMKVADDARKAFVAIGAGAAAAAGFATKLAEDYDVALRHVYALTGISAEQFESYKKQVLDLSTIVPKSATDLANGLYFVVSAGFQGADAMKILEASSKGAVAGLTDTRTVADAVTSALNAYKLSGAAAGDITGKLTQAVIEGKTEFGPLAGAIGRVLPIAAQLGVSFDEVMASMATMTRVGLNADEAATALRGTLASLAKPTSAARDELQKLGLSADGVRQELREKGLLAVLQEMMQKTHGNVDELGHIFPNIRALTGVLATAGSQGEQYNGILARMKQANAEAGAGAFAKTVEGASGQIGLMRNELEKVGIELGEKVLPYLVDLAKNVKDVVVQVEAWMKANPQLAEFAVKGLAVAAALSAVSFVVGPLVGVIGGLVAILGGPLLLTFGAIALAGYLLITHWEEIKESATLLWRIVVALFEKGVAAVGGFFDRLGTTVHDFIASVIQTVGGFVRNITDKIGEFVGWWQDRWTEITDHPLEKIGYFVGEALGRFVRFVVDTAKAIGEFFSNLPDRLGRWLRETLDAIGQFKDYAIFAVTQWIGRTARDVREFFEELPSRLGSWLTDSWNAVTHFTGEATTSFTKWIGDVAKAVGDFFGALPGRLAQFAMDAIAGFLKGLRDAAGAVTGAVGDFLKGFIGGFQTGLKSHSASLVFVALGADVDLGFAQGIADNTAGPIAAAQDLAAAVVKTTADTVTAEAPAIDAALQAAVQKAIADATAAAQAASQHLVAMFGGMKTSGAFTSVGSTILAPTLGGTVVQTAASTGYGLVAPGQTPRFWTTVAGVPTPIFHDGGVMPFDGLAYLARGERVQTREQQRSSSDHDHKVLVYLDGKQLRDAIGARFIQGVRLAGGRL